MAYKTDFIPIDYDYFDFNGKNYAKVIGRDKNGKRVCIIDSCDIFFWAILKEGLTESNIKKLILKIEKIQVEGKVRNSKVDKVELCDKNFLGKKVKALKIFSSNYKDLHEIADQLGMPEIEKRRGYDLCFATHYIIERKLTPLTWYEIEGEKLNNSEEFGNIDSHLEVDLCLKLESIKKAEEKEFLPKVLAFDIETEAFKVGEGEILLVSLVGENFKKVITWKKGGNLPYVEKVKDEADLLERFAQLVKEQSPDFLVGYFSDGFDLPYLKARAEKNHVKLNLGLDDSQPKFSRGVMTTAKIDGIIHIDLLRFIETAYSQYMQSETLSLNEVANELIGEEKKVFEFKHSSKFNEDEWIKYFEYNLQDSILAFKLFNKVWPDLLEFTRIMQEPVFNVSRNGMSANVEDYIIHNLNKFEEIPEKRPTYDEISERKQREKYEGAFVFTPTPGIYENLAIFDFTSMHASIMVTYNLSKATLLDEKEAKKEEHIESPELELNKEKKKFYFSKKLGFFPALLGEVVNLRKKYKKELKEKPDPIKKARSNAFKLLTNAYYGYMGFFGARYYSVEAAAATLAFVRKFNKWTMDRAEEEGYKVIFGDTDSIGFLLGEKSQEQAKQFLKKLNSELPGVMDLELEDFYKRGIWVTKRTGELGAKKKYALITEEDKLKVRGFETVRRDWCPLAREMQNKVLKLILKEGNEKKAIEYIKEVIQKLKNRQIELKQLTVRTQLKKALDEYKAITPHVIAAKKMAEKGIPLTQGGLVEYYIAETPGKNKLVREKVKLVDEKGEYDLEYYLKHQILPAIENILQVFNIDVNQLLEGKKQMTLGEF